MNKSKRKIIIETKTIKYAKGSNKKIEEKALRLKFSELKRKYRTKCSYQHNPFCLSSNSLVE